VTDGHGITAIWTRLRRNTVPTSDEDSMVCHESRSGKRDRRPEVLYASKKDGQNILKR
jgi:hypothetical protein